MARGGGKPDRVACFVKPRPVPRMYKIPYIYKQKAIPTYQISFENQKFNRRISFL